MTIRLPDEALLERLRASLKDVDSRMRDIILTHWLNLAVVAIFVVLAGVSGYLSYSASKTAEKANTAVLNGIYDKDGWSMVPGAYLNEYTAFTERPEWYAGYKEQYPKKTHY
jgi:hypothetical protein